MNIRDQLYLQVTDENNLLWELWEPEGIAVVIGYSQQAAREANVYACRMDGVPIIRRRGGGGAVVLMPGVLCVTCAFKSKLSNSPYFFFKLINEELIRLLQNAFSIQGLEYRGISDICIEDRKVLGCSIFKSRDLYFYQGSLLIHPELGRINQYLKHPSKEPDYRKGRRHSQFVTSLHNEGYPLSVKQVKKVIESEFNKSLRELLGVGRERDQSRREVRKK